MIRKIFTLILPPILHKIFYKQKYQYKGRYNNYLLAQKASPQIKIYEDNFCNPKFYSPNEVVVTDRFAITATLCGMLRKSKINVLDYGGGYNSVFSYIKQSTNKNVNCFILESYIFFKNFQNRIPKKFKKYIKYISNLNEINKKLDLIIFNSSLQYIYNYQVILKKIFFLKSPYIVITRTNFHNEKKNYFSIETGIKGSQHPYIFFSFEKLKKFFLKNNYKLIFSNKYNIGRYKHSSIKSDSYFHKDLIFFNKNNNN
jgi:putative methyltransferase (TIGR04325 family)